MARLLDQISVDIDRGIDDIMSGGADESTVGSRFRIRAAPFSADEVAELEDMNQSTFLP